MKKIKSSPKWTLDYESNMGTTDRVVRIITALAIGILYYFGVFSGLVATILSVAAGLFILTSLVSFCPLYPIFKLSTKKS